MHPSAGNRAPNGMNLQEKIRFRCAACDNPVAAPAVKAGARMRCPKCKGVVTVPAAAIAAIAAPEAEVQSPVPRVLAEEITRPGPGMFLRGDWLLFRCPSCRRWTKVRRQNFNQNVACGSCQTEFILELDA